MSTKKTPLYEEHKKLGGKVVDFAGFYLPVDYEGLQQEHEAVRNNVGLFDVSHMGEFTVKGKDALKFINYVCTNDYTKCADGQIQYSLLLHEDGGMVDDLLVYKNNDEDFLMVPNAANTEKDFKHISKYVDKFDVELKNISDSVAEIAIQGPKAEELLQRLVDYDLSKIEYYHFVKDIIYKEYDVLISRTGYTGEDGFEVYANAEAIVKLWDELLEKGKDLGVKPCGLGCRDTLRFEAAMPLYGNELSDDVSPLEVGLKFAVKMDKDDFVGKAKTQEKIDAGINKKLIGIEMQSKRIARQGAEVQKDGKTIGKVTTGYLSPTFGVCLANAFVDKSAVALGDEVDVVIRNKPAKATVVKRKFLDRK